MKSAVSKSAVSIAALASLLAGLLATNARAQTVQDIDLRDAPPDMVSADAPPSPALVGTAPAGLGGQARQAPAPAPSASSVISLGQSLGNAQGASDAPSPANGVSNSGSGSASDGASGESGGSAAPGVAAQAAQQAVQAEQATRGKSGKGASRLRRAVDDAGDGAKDSGPPERVVFERQSVRVPLPIGRERMITLPAVAALHDPADMGLVAHIQIIDRTVYVTALKPFTPIRVVAQLLDTGQLIPMDFVANATTAASTGELQISVVDPRGGVDGADGGAGGASVFAAAQPQTSGAQTQGLDMVELTRFAARQLYAPERLAYSVPGVVQVGVAQTPLPALIRGMDATVVPMGQWKSGPLYVTAVRVTNRSRYAQDIALEQLRGNWIAATAQHGRIGPAGSETDTTAIYLVCDRRFEACL